MKLLTAMLIEILNEEQKNLPQPNLASGPGERQEQIQTDNTNDTRPLARNHAIIESKF